MIYKKYTKDSGAFKMDRQMSQEKYKKNNNLLFTWLIILAEQLTST